MACCCTVTRAASANVVTTAKSLLTVPNLRWCSDGFELACDRMKEQAITTPLPLSLPKLILTW